MDDNFIPLENHGEEARLPLSWGEVIGLLVIVAAVAFGIASL
jgi:hypothetical protein